MSPDYEDAMRNPLPRAKLAEKLTPRALAERVVHGLLSYYPDHLELIHELLERRMREAGKMKIQNQR